MARFYLSADNSRGNQITAAGNAHGQQAHIRGWHSGVSVWAHPEGDVDVFDIYATGGSTGSVSRRRLGRVYKGPGGGLVFELDEYAIAVPDAA